MVKSQDVDKVVKKNTPKYQGCCETSHLDYIIAVDGVIAGAVGVNHSTGVGDFFYCNHDAYRPAFWLRLQISSEFSSPRQTFLKFGSAFIFGDKAISGADFFVKLRDCSGLYLFLCFDDDV